MNWVLTAEEIDVALDEAIKQAASRGESLSSQQIKMFAAASSDAEAAKKRQEGSDVQAVQAPASRKRGRPPKEREPEYDHKAAIGSGTLADISNWEAGISSAVAREYPNLTSSQLHDLLEKLVHAAGHYTYGRQLRANDTSNSTRKPHTEKPVLIYECARAWEAVTGEPLTVWHNADSTILQESPAMKLARVVAATIGRPLVGDTRRHAEKAREMLNKQSSK